MYITAIHRPWRKLRGGICGCECESLHVQPSCCVNVVVYMLNCVFWRHIPLEIEFKSRSSDSNAQRYHPLAVAQLVTPKKKTRKIERGEFITPPRPTGRRSNVRFNIKGSINLFFQKGFLFPP